MQSSDLLGAALEALRHHVDLVNRLCVIPHSGSGFEFLSVRPHGAPSHHVERLLVGSGKCDAHNTPRRRDQAKEFSVRTDYLHTGTRGDVNPALRVNRRSITVSTRFKLGKISLVRDRTIGLNIEGNQSSAVGHVKRLLIAAKNDAVGSEGPANADGLAIGLHVEIS